MKRSFRHYFKPATDTLSEAWQNGLFSFDANVLLNIYAYSTEAREDLVRFAEQNAARIRLAHQFGLEYARNRVSVILKQASNCARVEKSLRQIKETDIARKREHPYLTEESSKAFDAIQKELAESRATIEKWVGSDPYAERIFKVFENRMGECPTEEALSQLHMEAARRYERYVPPGYADLKEKGVPDAYADYVGWHQLMQIAKAEAKSVIFVTDDVKEDWWYMGGEPQYGPRPELLQEFALITQREVYLYNSDNFLRAVTRFTAADIRYDTIEEVTERLEGQREGQRAVGLKAVSAQLRIEHLEGMLAAASAEKTSEPGPASPTPQGKPEKLGA